MTTAVAVDYRTALLSFRAAIRAVRQSPDPSTLAELSRATLQLPESPSNALVDDEKHVALLRVLEFAQESQFSPASPTW